MFRREACCQPVGRRLSQHPKQVGRVGWGAAGGEKSSCGFEGERLNSPLSEEALGSLLSASSIWESNAVMHLCLFYSDLSHAIFSLKMENRVETFMVLLEFS